MHDIGRAKRTLDYKKEQLTLTINWKYKKQIENAASASGLSVQQIVSRYLEKHIDEIVDYTEKVAKLI